MLLTHPLPIPPRTPTYLGRGCAAERQWRACWLGAPARGACRRSRRCASACARSASTTHGRRSISASAGCDDRGMAADGTSTRADNGPNPARMARRAAIGMAAGAGAATQSQGHTCRISSSGSSAYIFSSSWICRTMPSHTVPMRSICWHSQTMSRPNSYHSERGMQQINDRCRQRLIDARDVIEGALHKEAR